MHSFVVGDRGCSARARNGEERAPIGVIPGATLGIVLTGGLTERAGFVSPILTLLALVVIWSIALAAPWLVGALRPLGSWQTLVVTGAVGLFASAVAVRNTLLEAD